MARRKKASPQKQSPQRRKSLKAKTNNQQIYIDEMVDADVTFCSGPAGSGKTSVAVGLACEYLMEERVKKFELDEDIVRRHMTQGEILEDVMGNYKRYESKRSALGNVILDSNLIRFSYSIPDPLARFIKADAERLINKRQKEELEEDG